MMMRARIGLSFSYCCMRHYYSCSPHTHESRRHVARPLPGPRLGALLAPSPRARAAPRLSGAHVPQARASPCQNCTRMRTRLYLRLALNVSASSVSLL